eukprot:COSAG01_NODE_696_length_14189_cov_31.024769_11_plen_251_part_00
MINRCRTARWDGVSCSGRVGHRRWQVAFPFQLLFALLRPLVLLVTLLGRTLRALLTALRQLVGLGAPAAQVASSVSMMQSMQNLWTQVLRPIKAVIKSCYDSIIMISTKLLKHRLTLERWLEAKRTHSRLASALLSRTFLGVLVVLALLLVLESVLAELLTAALLMGLAALAWGSVMRLRGTLLPGQPPPSAAAAQAPSPSSGSSLSRTIRSQLRSASNSLLRSPCRVDAQSAGGTAITTATATTKTKEE